MMRHSALPAKDQAARVFFFKAARARNPETPVAALWQGALAELHFRRSLTASVKANKKRSAAAKRGWAKRRAEA